MEFSSIVFLSVFLPVVYVLYLLIRQPVARNVLLTVASFFFYAYGEPVYVLLMLGSTLMNYAAGRLMGNAKDPYRRRSVLVWTVVANLGLLVVFKYTDMIIGTLNAVFVQNFALTGIELPIGISFYTFQAMSYVIDVYRREVEPERSYLKVALYISLFPQLIAGPIVKYHDIADQLTARTCTPHTTSKGVTRFIIGLCKKVLIANTVAVAVDALYALSPDMLNAGSVWVAAGAYMIQIYFDFSGYSDMAIGLGQMFGFTFPENFNYPYTASSMRDFWRRWHISLTTWFREYLYIPLGGNRRGPGRTAFNKLVVFFLTGLWHGPSWTYVVWGMLNGGAMLASDTRLAKRIPKFVGHIITLFIVCTAFVFFRSETMDQALGMIRIMFTGGTYSAASMSYLVQQLTPAFITAAAAGAVLSCPVLRIISGYTRRHRYTALRALGYIAGMCLLIICMMVLSTSAYNPFIYFRF